LGGGGGHREMIPLRQGISLSLFALSCHMALTETVDYNRLTAKHRSLVARGNQTLSNAFSARLNDPSLAEVNFLLHPD